jgi:uncharacterized protein (UPF0335 family)
MTEVLESDKLRQIIAKIETIEEERLENPLIS